MNERVVVVGGGAMGGLFAAAIAASGRDTAIVDVAPAVLDAIAANGLRVTTADGERSYPMRATADPSTLGIADIVLVFVKAAHTRSAGAALGPLIGPYDRPRLAPERLGECRRPRHPRAACPAGRSASRTTAPR